MGLMLQKTPLFNESFSREFLYDLAREIEEVRYSEGEVVFLQEQQEWDDLSIYYVMKGIYYNNIKGLVEIYIVSGSAKFPLCQHKE